MKLWGRVVVPALVCMAMLAAVGCSKRNSRAERALSIDDIYALEEIPLFHIELDREALDQLSDKPRKFARAKLRYGDIVREAAVRLKGHRSMRKLDGKSAFKLRFDKWDADGEFLGLKTMTLNNMVEDSTKMREILGYRVAREMGLPAPKVGYVNVQVNDQRFGLYALVESVDRAFLAKRFADPTGNLYEGEYGCDLFPDDVAGFDKDAGEVESRADLEAFAAAAWPAEGAMKRLLYAPDAPLDRDAFLAYLAVSAFIGDFDGYRHSHNYRIYHEPTLRKWYFIPWGYDRVLKKRIDIYDSQGLLAKRCFADPRCRLDYLRTLRRVSEKFESLRLEQALPVLSSHLAESLDADPRLPHERTKMRADLIRLRKFIEERPDEIRGALACLGKGDGEVDADGDGHGCMDCDDGDPNRHPEAGEACDGIDNDCSGVADDDPACPCPTVVIEGATFALCERPMPWVEAAAFCEAMGATLARIDSKPQSRQLRRAADEHDRGRWWIGLSDRDEEGTFGWSDGAPVAFTRWSKNEPDNDACNQDCVALREKAKGRWNDTHCGQHRSFICRLPDGSATERKGAQ